MELLEESSHSFIVKVWLERAGQGARGARWRGYVTHVTSESRLYFEDLGEVDSFIGSYLEIMGIELSTYCRVRRWFERWQQRNNR